MRQRSHPSEVTPTGEMIGHLRASQLIDREPMSAGRREGTDRSVRELEHAPPFPAAQFELMHGFPEVRDAIHQDPSLTFQVAGKQDRGRMGPGLDHGNAGAHALDGEHQSGFELIEQVVGGPAHVLVTASVPTSHSSWRCVARTSSGAWRMRAGN